MKKKIVTGEREIGRPVKFDATKLAKRKTGWTLDELVKAHNSTATSVSVWLTRTRKPGSGVVIERVRVPDRYIFRIKK